MAVNLAVFVVPDNAGVIAYLGKNFAAAKKAPSSREVKPGTLMH